MNTKNLLVGIGLCLLLACTEVDNKLEVNRALEYCDRQVHRTLEVMHGKGREVDYTMMPRNIMDGQYDWNYRKVSKEEWCGGFGRASCGMIMNIHKIRNKGRGRKVYCFFEISLGDSCIRS